MPEIARRLVQVALDGLARIGEPYLDAVAALVAASLPGDDVAALVARARTGAATIGEPAFAAAVDAVVDGRYGDAGMLLPLARRIERSRATRTSATRVAVLEGRVMIGAEIVPLRERELELVVALALERRPLTREMLVSRLWPEVTSDEANAALRTAIYRLRKQLGDSSAVVSTAAGYQLAQTIPVDLLEAEQFVSAARRLGALSDRERARLTALLELLSSGLPTVYARWDWFAPYEQRDARSAARRRRRARRGRSPPRRQRRRARACGDAVARRRAGRTGERDRDPRARRGGPQERSAAPLPPLPRRAAARVRRCAGRAAEPFARRPRSAVFEMK